MLLVVEMKSTSLLLIFLGVSAKALISHNFSEFS